ncbi:hypothetical protein D3C78_775570 [compost metagenome]
MPYEYEHNSPKPSRFITKPWQIEEGPACFLADSGEALDEDKLPDEAEQQAADHVRHEEDRPQYVSCLQLLGKQIGQEEADNIRQNDTDKREAQREPEG